MLELKEQKKILNDLYHILDNCKRYDSKFLIGIKEGKIIEKPYTPTYNLPISPRLTKILDEYEWIILIDANKYTRRVNNKYSNPDFNNDFDFIRDKINELNIVPNKIVSYVTVKPDIDDGRFLSVLAEVTKSRDNKNMYFDSEFLNGFSCGTWRIITQKRESNIVPQIQTADSGKFTTLFINIPIENYKFRKDNGFNNDFDYLKQYANDIKHFEETIDAVEMKPL